MSNFLLLLDLIMLVRPGYGSGCTLESVVASHSDVCIYVPGIIKRKDFGGGWGWSCLLLFIYSLSTFIFLSISIVRLEASERDMRMGGGEGGAGARGSGEQMGSATGFVVWWGHKVLEYSVLYRAFGF